MDLRTQTANLQGQVAKLRNELIRRDRAILSMLRAARSIEHDIAAGENIGPAEAACRVLRAHLEATER